MGIELYARCDNCGFEKEAWSANDIAKFDYDNCGDTYCIKCDVEQETCKECQLTFCGCVNMKNEVCEDCEEEIEE